MLPSSPFQGIWMSPGPPKFEPEQKAFLRAIRDDLGAHPDLYREGSEYLSRRFSIDALHAADLARWEKFRHHPLEEAGLRAKAAHAAWLFTWPDDEPDERDRIEREVLAKLGGAPRKDHGYELCHRLARAFSALLQEGLDTPDDVLEPYDLTKVKAVLFLTWLLTDPDANKHPLGEAYGSWLSEEPDDAEPSEADPFFLKLAAKGRAVARMSTLDELNQECRSRWMALACRAWAALGRPRHTVPRTYRDALADVPVPPDGSAGNAGADEGEQGAQPAAICPGDPRARITSPPAEPRPSHSVDFTGVNWFGDRYTFTKGQQARAIACLWAEFEKGELGLSQTAIGEAIETSNETYRLDQTFRQNAHGKRKKPAEGTMHPAWGRMIQKVAPGMYRLVKPRIPG
jgi:hypothetical protein